MKLRGINFGKVFCASGARNIHGKGWWYADPVSPWEGSVLVTKTVTLHDRPGNMPTTDTLRLMPKEWYPRCIKVFPLQGAAINSVGLTNPGIEAVLEHRLWHELEGPLILSFMPLGKTPTEQQREAKEYVKILKPELEMFQAYECVAQEINVSCPNVKQDIGTTNMTHVREFTENTMAMADIFAELEIPIIFKFNALAPPQATAKAAQHEAIDAIHMGNTIPFGAETTPPIEWWRFSKWKGLLGIQSPLAGRRNEAGELMGNGGLSGKPIKPVNLNWIKQYRKYDKKTMIIAGGGIFSEEDIWEAKEVGANAISIGTKAMPPFGGLKELIRRANTIF